MRYDYYSTLLFGRTDWKRLGAREGTTQARRRFGERLTIEEEAALAGAREKARTSGRLASARFAQAHPSHRYATLLCRAVAHPDGRWMIGLIAPGGQPSAWMLKADWPQEPRRVAAHSTSRAAPRPDRTARLIARLTAFLKARRVAGAVAGRNV
jgi:hypothetical protein